MISKELVFGREKNVALILAEGLEINAREYYLDLEFSEVAERDQVLKWVIDCAQGVNFDVTGRLKAYVVRGKYPSSNMIEGGYILEYYPGRSKTPFCTVISSLNDSKWQKPIFIYRENRGVKVAKGWGNEKVEEYYGLEDLCSGNMVETKLMAILGHIDHQIANADDHDGRDVTMSVLQTVQPAAAIYPHRVTMGWDPLRDDPVWLPAKYRESPSQVGFAVNKENKVDEPAEDLEVSKDTVKIIGFPDDLAESVKRRLEKGATELKRMGVDLAEMQFGGVYDNGKNKERIYRAYAGNRNEGQYVVSVIQGSEESILGPAVGLILDRGEGREAYTLIVMSGIGSNVEISVVCDGKLRRAIFAGKSGNLLSVGGNGKNGKAESILKQYFGKKSYIFKSAFNTIRELTRQQYDWLGK